MVVRPTAAQPSLAGGSVPSGSGRPEALVESYRRLAEVFHDVLSEQSLDALLDRIAETLSDLMPYEALHIYEVDEERRELVPLLASSQAYADEIMQDRPRFGEGITGWAVENRQPVWTNRAHLDPRVVNVPGTPVEPEALITVPLIARGALKGALNIYRIGEDATFYEHEFELAKWFGDAAALALDNAQIRARLEHLAQTDSLTGLYNHRFFHERLRSELTLASRSRDPVAVLMFDLDDFKRVNDVYGHGAGDQVLVQVARIARETVRALGCGVPHRRRRVRRDHAVVRGGWRSRSRCAPHRAPAGSRPGAGRPDDGIDRHLAGPAARDEPSRADRLR